jgi:hypothetical protein
MEIRGIAQIGADEPRAFATVRKVGVVARDRRVRAYSHLTGATQNPLNETPILSKRGR